MPVFDEVILATAGLHQIKSFDPVRKFPLYSQSPRTDQQCGLYTLNQDVVQSIPRTKRNPLLALARVIPFGGDMPMNAMHRFTHSLHICVCIGEWDAGV